MEVTRLGITPVKGARHAVRDELVFDASGAVGDRAFCFVDAVSHQVLRTVQNPRLLAIDATYDGASLTLELPDRTRVQGRPRPTGEMIESDYWGRRVRLEVMAGPFAELVSTYLGFPVLLAAAPRGQVIYGAPISFVTTASLRRVADRVGLTPDNLEAARFRATLLLGAGDEPFAEDAWAGRELAVGDARIRVREPIPRCAVVDLDPATGVAAAKVLKALADLRPPQGPRQLSFGWDAVVTRPGIVRPGDRVELLD
ncbi:MOSC domain-containing protein [Nocardioides sp.]|uniref:MOSC domain-containing protein n=1 Tax=Nocardioides sp. TaxID=35761 RepID=UPI003565DE0C